MGSNCYCNVQSEPGSVPVPPLDKTIDVSKDANNIDNYNRQESYSRIFSINKNELKPIRSIKNNEKVEEEKDNDNLKKVEEIKSLENFEKGLLLCSTQIAEEQFTSLINEKIKKIEIKFGQINQAKKLAYTKNKNIIFKPPLFFKDSNIFYYGSWNPSTCKKEGWGITIDKEGNKYEGAWKNDLMNGYGRMISKNGDFYEGEISKGCIQGKGVFYSNDKKMVFKGDFKNNMIEGKGEQIFETVDNVENKNLIYEGHFRAGKREGHGKLNFADENIYEGKFVEDKYETEGIFKWKDGREYKGMWKDNNMEGKGIFTWDKNIWYEGEYKDNRKEGFGTYHFGPDNYYEGKWLNNLPHGQGKYKAKGTVVEGLFRFGKIIRNKKNTKNTKESKEGKNLKKQLSKKK